MPTLSLGVLDVAYTQREPGQKPKRTTTGDVAEILERNYHVMGTFYELKKVKIADLIAADMANALNDRLHGRTVGRPFFDAETQIEAMFRTFLDANEMNKISVALTGTPISAAADRGVSHRRKRPYVARAARPAFVDTGLYRISFRATFRFSGGGTEATAFLGIKNLRQALSDRGFSL